MSSRIKTIRLSLVDNNSKIVRHCDVLSPCGYDQYFVRWVVAKKKSPYNQARTYLDPRWWKVLRLEVFHEGNSSTTWYLDKTPRKEAWDKVDDSLSRMLGCSTPRQTRKRAQVPGDRKEYKPSFVWVRGCKVRNEAAAEIVKKYYDHARAMAIFPDSWVDKKLTEAYNSRRTKNKTEESKESE